MKARALVSLYYAQPVSGETIRLVFWSYFIDVDTGINTVQEIVTVDLLADDWTQAKAETAITNAVQAKGSILGYTLSNNDIVIL